ncbi:MAG: endonuclease [Bacteroidetes bacterium]|nr:endonuclease [Bacteroidota bacterium]
MRKIYLLLIVIFSLSLNTFSQGSESFSNIGGVPNVYATQNWTGDNGLPWVATDTRTDQTMNGKAIVVRNGAVSCNNIPNGIQNLTFLYQQFYSGSGGVLEVYINNVLIGSVNPTATVATASFSNINVSGNFNLQIKQTKSGLRIGIDDITWTGYNATPCEKPTSQPTALSLSSTPNTVTANYTAAAPAPDEYLVVRSTDGTYTAPTDGTAYTAGQALGTGVIVGYYSGTSFIDNTVQPATTYYYYLFSVNDQDCGGGPSYLTTAPLSGNIATPALPACSTPPAAPTNFAFTAGNKNIDGSFTAAANANRYLVVMSASATLSATPQNGTTYTAGQAFGGGTIVAFTAGTTFSVANLTPNTTYYFFIFAANSECTGEPFYNTTYLGGTATTTNNTGIPAGYYDGANGLTCQALKTQLRDIVSTGYVQLTYTPGVWQAYQYTDLHRNDANTADIIWDIYSDNPSGPEPYTYTYQVNQCGSYSKEGDCYNREHSTPKSWFADAYPMYTDVNHLYPTDGYVNNMRSNYPYGEVATISYESQNHSKLGTGNNFGYTGIVFEPINEFKGDLARTSMYMATRYENEIIANNWSANGTADALFLSPSDEPDAAKRKLQIYDTWYLKTIFKWNDQDPVSQKETDRNNAIYYSSGQHNRNPFIDHPEYAAMIWQCTGLLPVTIIDFTATRQSSSILLQWYATYETSFKEYEVQSSTDGVHFIKSGIIKARNLSNYSYVDEQLPDANMIFYRLKMIDQDGKYAYSKIVSVRLNNNFSNAVVFPNPVKSELKIQLKKLLPVNSTMRIIDMTGRVIKTQTISSNTGYITENVAGLPAGRYFIKIVSSQEVINSSFIIVK